MADQQPPVGTTKPPHERACELLPIEKTDSIHRPWVLHAPHAADETFHNERTVREYRDRVAAPIAAAIAAAERDVRAAIATMAEEAADAHSERYDALMADGMNNEAWCAGAAADALHALVKKIRALDAPGATK